MPSDVQEGWGNKTSTDAEVTGDVDATIDGIGIITYFNRDSKPGSASGETTIVSDVYQAGTFQNFVLGVVSAGDGYAFYRFKKNGVILQELTTGPGYNERFDFIGAPVVLQVGDTISITGEHNTGSRDYYASIFGYV